MPLYTYLCFDQKTSNMANVIFYLKSKKTNLKGEIQLIAQVALDYKKYRKQIGKVKKSDWNQTGQRLKIPKIEFQRNEAENERKVTFNKFLAKIVEKVENLSNNAVLENRKLTLDEVKELFLTDDSATKTKPFLELFQDFIDSNKPSKAERTIKGYTTVLNFLTTFEKEAKFTITWEHIDDTFVDSLMKYTLVTKEYQNGYFVKIIRVIRTFLHWAKRRGYYAGEIIKDTDIKEPDKEVIFLSLEELFTLYNYNFESERLSSTRDLYCFSSFSGLRWSDLYTLRHEHISSQYIITKTQKKPGVIKSVPLNRYAIEILEKNQGSEYPLPIKASQNVNDDIKDCLKEIAKKQPKDMGFNRMLIETKHYGKKTKDESKPLHEIITFHTSRKTFITNSIMLGVNIKVLQDMGAPQKDKDLRKYLKITDAFKQQSMDNSWNKLNYPSSIAEIV